MHLRLFSERRNRRNRKQSCSLQSPFKNRTRFKTTILNFPVLQILLAPETQTALCQGLASSACYDGIIYLCRLIWKRFHHHPFYKIQDGKIEKSPANIQFVIDNNRLILPVDVDKDKYEYAVDRFMEKAFASNPDERTFFYYSDDQQTILCKTESRIIKDEIEKRQNKS